MRMRVYRTENNTTFDLAACLQVIFIVLKLTNLIQWSWWWVLSPTWISFGLFLIIVIILCIHRFVITHRSY